MTDRCWYMVTAHPDYSGSDPSVFLEPSAAHAAERFRRTAGGWDGSSADKPLAVSLLVDVEWFGAKPAWPPEALEVLWPTPNPTFGDV